MGVPFYLLSGGGNDFVALVEPALRPTAEQIRLWCRRGISVGADGLFVLDRRDDGVGMEYFNADGEAADLCLNGSRCAVRLATELGWLGAKGTLFTGIGPLGAETLAGDRVALELERPTGTPQRLEITVQGEPVTGSALRVGVPHFVIPWEEELDVAPVARMGPAVRAHPRFQPEGTNVDYVRVTAAGHLEIRTYERGVEAETLACGTGVLAATAVALERGSVELPAVVRTQGGFLFRVAPGGSSDTWKLIGDARLVARGEIMPGAEAQPDGLGLD